MKRLILLRHGKSDWNADYDTDHERPLNRRGVKSAEAVGRFLAAAGEVPDLIISSTAVRARTTAELASTAGAWNRPLQLVGALYGASPGEVVRIAQEVDDDVGSLMLVGHNPTWENLAALLTGGSGVQMKTATVAAIDFMTPAWQHLKPGRGSLAWMLQPRLLLKAGLPPGT